MPVLERHAQFVAADDGAAERAVRGFHDQAALGFDLRRRRPPPLPAAAGQDIAPVVSAHFTSGDLFDVYRAVLAGPRAAIELALGFSECQGLGR